MIRLIPIAQTQVDWDTFLREVSDALKRNPLEQLNARWITPTKSLSDFVVALKEIDMPGSEPFEAANHLLTHIHVSFILVCTDAALLEIINRSRLHFTAAKSCLENFRISIVSGTLHEWRSALLNCCSNGQSFEVREFGTLAFGRLEYAAMIQYMSLEFILTNDRTIRLLEKRKVSG